MHNRGRGELTEAHTTYRDVVIDVRDELLAAVERALVAGVSRANLWIDPGIGFAKTARQSLMLLANTERLVETGYPVIVGPSRKSFIGEVARDRAGRAPSSTERLGGTAAAVAAAVLLGARAVRVHDVREMAQATAIAVALRGARGGI
jgi:dihydropteroate synthase